LPDSVHGHSVESSWPGRSPSSFKWFLGGRTGWTYRTYRGRHCG